MPRLTVQSLAGRSIQQKRELARRLTDAVVLAYGMAPEAVTIVFDDVLPENHAKAGVLSVDRAAPSQPSK